MGEREGGGGKGGYGLIMQHPLGLPAPAPHLPCCSLSRWDLRAARGKVAESPVVNYQEGKDYSRGTNFTCMATSGDGYVVVGAQVRRYIG